MTKKGLVDSLRVSSPCTESWDAMTGNNKVRFCSHCDLNVNNLSEMSRKEAMRFVQKSDGKICVRYIKNPKTNAPVFAEKLYQISRRAGIAAGVLGASLAVSAVSYAQGRVSISNNLETQTEITQNKQSQNEKKAGNTASISGTVIDPNGAVIPNATVSISGKSFNRIITTNENGDYLFSQIPAEEYSLKVESGGFDTKKMSVSVSEGRETVANATLEVGEQFVIMGVMVSVEYEQPLLRAVSEEDFDEVTTLIATGADVNAKDKNYNGITALFLAVESGNIKMVETLLNFGAKINVRDDEKRTPLMALDYDATPELVNLLLRYNAKVSAVDKEGNSVLHRVAESNNAEIIQLLIKENADINAQNKEGQTPLMIAVYYENIETVKALLSAGAKVNIRDNEDKTALSIVKGKEGEEGEEIAKLLIQYGAKE
jgi:ankyrin repeat protein